MPEDRPLPPTSAQSASSTRDPNWPAVTAGSGVAPQVDPHLYLHPRTLARLANFELRSKLIVEGVMAGQHRSPYSGVSVEFAQHRPYAPGDETRRLDWKVFARTDRLQIKQHEQETTLDLIVMVDSSGSMRYGSRLFADASGTAQDRGPRGEANWTKFDHATALAAALAYITLHQGDRVGMVVFAEQIRSIVNRSSSRGTWRQIVDVLSLHPVDKPTDLLRAVEQTAAKLTNRCLFAIVSDFFDAPEQVRAAMGRLRHRGHDLICFQVLDRAEETFDLRDAAPFVGLEGEPMVRVDPRSLRTAYLEAFAEHEAAISRAARGLGFDLHRVGTHEWLGPTLAAFVARRNAMMRRGAGTRGGRL